MDHPTMLFLGMHVKRSVLSWKLNWKKWNKKRSQKSMLFVMNWQRWRSVRTTTRTTFPKLKIVLTMKNKSFVPKLKLLRNSGMSTTPTSLNWRTSRRTNQNLLSLKGKQRRSIYNLGLRPLNFHPGREVLFMKFVLQAEIDIMKTGKRG